MTLQVVKLIRLTSLMLFRWVHCLCSPFLELIGDPGLVDAGRHLNMGQKLTNIQFFCMIHHSNPHWRLLGRKKIVQQNVLVWLGLRGEMYD